MVICLERGADLHTAQLMPLPLTVSCFSKIQIGFTFLVSAHPGSPGQRAVKRVCVCVCVCDACRMESMSVRIYVAGCLECCPGGRVDRSEFGYIAVDGRAASTDQCRCTRRLRWRSRRCSPLRRSSLPDTR